MLPERIELFDPKPSPLIYLRILRRALGFTGPEFRTKINRHAAHLGRNHRSGQAGSKSDFIIAKAKAEGKYKGRKPTARAKADDVLRLHGEGRTPTEIAKAIGVGRGSVYRIVAMAAAESAGGRFEAVPTHPS